MNGKHFIRMILTAAAFVSPFAAAQDFPTKPIRFVVGFAAGGPTDVIARIIGQDVTAMYGQPVVIDNRTGANSLIATEMVAAATPDGYTVLIASLSHNVNTILVPKVNYGPLKSFAPVSLISVLPLLLIAKSDAPFNSAQELVKLARVKPGDVTYGSAGNGGSAHLAAALLETTAKVKMTHVPFRGNALALAEILGGRITFMPWVGALVPAGTPPAIVNKLNEAIRTSIAKPESKKRLEGLGSINIGSSPAEFTEFLKKDHERWARVIKAAGVKYE